MSFVRSFAIVAVSFGLVAGLSARADAATCNEVSASGLNQLMTHSLLERAAGIVKEANAVNWKVGDKNEYKVSAGFLGGTMMETVSREEGNAIWMHEETKLVIQNDTVDMLISRLDAKVLKYIHNGREETPPENKVEIINSQLTTVTVPAGTFSATHVTIKTPQVEKAEMWVNQDDIPMDGMIKTMVPQQGQQITIELTKLTRGQ